VGGKRREQSRTSQAVSEAKGAIRTVGADGGGCGGSAGGGSEAGMAIGRGGCIALESEGGGRIGRTRYRCWGTAARSQVGAGATGFRLWAGLGSVRR
jgi:hypothetical protein